MNAWPLHHRVVLIVGIPKEVTSVFVRLVTMWIKVARLALVSELDVKSSPKIQIFELNYWLC